MKPTGSALLEFNPELNKLSKGKELRDGLSVVVQVGDTLWVANDETISLERLSRQTEIMEDAHNYGEHRSSRWTTFFGFPSLVRLIPKRLRRRTWKASTTKTVIYGWSVRTA